MRYFYKYFTSQQIVSYHSSQRIDSVCVGASLVCFHHTFTNKNVSKHVFNLCMT